MTRAVTVRLAQAEATMARPNAVRAHTDGRNQPREIRGGEVLIAQSNREKRQRAKQQSEQDGARGAPSGTGLAADHAARIEQGHPEHIEVPALVLLGDQVRGDGRA